MRVGVVCPYDLSEPGGVQDQVVGLAGALRGLGHAVTVIAPGHVPAGVAATNVGRAYRFRVNGSIAPMAPHPAAALRTVHATRGGRFDVLHLHEPMAPSITIPALLAHAAPVVATFHAAGDRTPYRWAARPLHRLARRIDARVAVSEAAARLARQHLGGCYDIVGNGIDTTRFHGLRRIGPVGRRILFLGRHEPRKGLDVLLEAIPALPSDVTVQIAGVGPATASLRLRHRGDPRVEWLGPLTETAKRQRLATASVLCAPSRHGESFGMVLLEAMAAGTPVVATDLPGYRSLSHGGDAALLVPPDDSRALGAALRRVLSDDRLAERLRRRGAEQARHFAMDTVARRYVEIYEQTVERRRRPAVLVVH